MKSMATKKTNGRALKAGALFLFTTGALLVAAHGCSQGHEGDRCNPALTNVYGSDEDECGSGLACGQPADCPESYCCPDGGATSPFCAPGCNGGQASICNAGGDADCSSLDDGGPG